MSVCLTGHHFNNGCQGSNPANPTKKKWSLAGTNKYPESHKKRGIFVCCGYIDFFNKKIKY
jgi:hypothetical protein